MCGIIGIISENRVNLEDAIAGLEELQHRGQDAAGIVTYEDSKFNLYKKTGSVQQVFQESIKSSLHGTACLAHVRYKTAGTSKEIEAQPFLLEAAITISLVHNGNLTNYLELRNHLEQSLGIHFKTESDSELILNLFSHEINKRKAKECTMQNVLDSIRVIHKRCHGSYAVLLLIEGFGLVAFQDPFAIRPLVFGENYTKNAYMFASESVALEAAGYKLLDDVKAAEAVIIDQSGTLSRHQVSQGKLSPCIFEFIYFARPKSIMHGIKVDDARVNMGISLGKRIKEKWGQYNIDVVVPVPATSKTSALALAQELGISYGEGLVKRKHASRTFIMSGQERRKRLVREKFTINHSIIKDKNVLVVDDSIVRGTTSREIVKILKENGAAQVFFASIAPKICFPNMYGIDLPTAKELIANQYDDKGLAETLGVVDILFQELDDIKDAITARSSQLEDFETSMFDGVYLDFANHMLPITWLFRHHNLLFGTDIWCKQQGFTYERPSNCLALVIARP